MTELFVAEVASVSPNIASTLLSEALIGQAPSFIKSPTQTIRAELLRQMTGYVEDPKSPYLTSYKSDFYDHDVQEISERYESGSRYLWVLREYGTYLTQLGIHPMVTERALAELHSGARGSVLGCKTFLVTDKGCKPANDAQIKTEMSRYDYSLKGKSVTHKQGIWSVVFDAQRIVKQSDGNAYANVQFTTNSPLVAFSRKDIRSLILIAQSEAINVTGTLFCKMNSVLLNGLDVYDIYSKK